MARVATFRQCIERLAETVRVLSLYSFLESSNRSFHDFVDQLRYRKLSVLLCWMECRGVRETFVQFIQFIAGQRPVCIFPANHSFMWRIWVNVMISPRPGVYGGSAGRRLQPVKFVKNAIIDVVTNF